ncbi:NUDIX hydrolase [Streptomyces sp. NPDC097619]|uniref:NUDIX hydrolase n=1 Tax=Streptomyces sp. NPDC097619 TaxID=3157228 RepID=UPI003323D523
MTDTWLPPREYIATLPANTAYAALYCTDREGRPLQLRTVYGTETWHLPGGNLDPGEGPFRTAVRECREETGIVFRGEPRLLAVHFEAPRGEEWPCNQLGFVFDGGVLTDDQIAGVVLDPAEHCAYRVDGLAGWEREMAPADFRRLAAAAEARRTGVTAYLER